VAGIARHTLLTSAARREADPAAALTGFGPLIDHWHGFGAWTQLWIAVRALVETLSRLGRHRDVAVLLGAQRVSPRASTVFGADAARVQAVDRAARAALGPAFDALCTEGAALGDAGAVALARRLTRPALDVS
jgi:transposase